MLIELYKQRRLRRLLQRFKKHYQIDKAVAQFDPLFAGVDGFALSAAARGTSSDDSLTYGEIDFLHFCLLMSHVTPNAQDVFFDLGAGTGKAVIAAALVFPFKQCIGVELLPALVKKSINIKESLDPTLACKIDFQLGDFLAHDLTKATVVFINATAFFGDTLDKITSKLSTLSENCRIIISSKTLPSETFSLHFTSQVLMSWGPASVRIYQPKVNNLKQ